MIFSYDKFNRLDKPQLYLAKPNKKYIGTIQGRELVSDLFFNGISEVKFKVNKYENGEVTLHYDEIEKLKLVEVSYIGWFQITDEHDVGDGSNIYKEVTALSLENELTTKLLTSFGSMGVESDEIGGLDRYCLYNIADVSHSILHIVLEKTPTWKIGFIDPDITSEYRGFNNDSVDAYSFLMGDVSTEFQCVFQFDTFEKSISAYKLENMGKMTGIYLSYRNLVKQIDVQSNASDIKTVMYVAGGDDRGTPLGVIEVNPSGTNMISNFSYYKSWMSDELRTKYEAYETEYNNRLTNFTSAIDTLQTLYEQLSNIQNRVPSVEHSTTWSQYGLVELQTEYDYYKNKMSLYLDGKNETLRLQYKSLCDTITAQIKIRQTEYNNKLTQINNQKVLCDSLTLNLEDYLGVELYKELSTYAHYTDFVDDTFVVTDNMTDEEVLQMKRDLLNMAHTELGKVCKPSYTMTVDSLNFTQIPEFKTYSDQLYLGNLLTVEFDEGVLVESRLLKMHIEWDNPDNFQLTFSSKNRLTEGWTEFIEIQQQANSASRSQVINGTGWNNAKNKTNTFDNYMKSALDTSLQKLKSGSNEQFIIDGTGTMWKRWDDAKNDFSPRQMWGVGNGLFLSENNWQTVSLAIGELDLGGGVTKYGIAAPLVMGKLLLGENLNIINSSGNFTIDNNGFKATNGIYSVGINPNTPSEIINVKVNGTNQLYVDTVKKKLVYKGDLEAVGGTFSGNLSAVGGTFTGTLNGVDGTFTGTINANQISGGILRGVIVQQISNEGNISATLSQDTIGGRLNIYDAYGNLNVQIGVESGTGGNVGGTLILCNDGDQKKRVALAIDKTKDVGVMQLYRSDGTMGTQLTPTSGYINGYEIITDETIGNMTVDYANRSGYATSAGSAGGLVGVGTNVTLYSNTLRPDRDNSLMLGSPSYRWTTVYASSSTISTSDKTKKKNIAPMTDKQLEFFKLIIPVTYQFIDGTSGRTHYGFVSQDIEIAMQKCGLTSLDFAGFIKSPKYSKIDEETGEYDVNSEIVGYDYFLRYEEFIALNTYIIQQQQSRIEEIERRLILLENI